MLSELTCNIETPLTCNFFEIWVDHSLVFLRFWDNHALIIGCAKSVKYDFVLLLHELYCLISTWIAD